MSLEPHGSTTADGEQQQQQSARSWSACRQQVGQAATSGGGGGATTATTHTDSGALFNGAALLLDAASTGAGQEVSAPSNHGLVVDPMPTHITTSKEAMTSKAKGMNKNNNVSEITMSSGNPTGTATTIDESSSNANGRLYATVHPGFWRIEGKQHTAKILVKIRMKVCMCSGLLLLSNFNRFFYSIPFIYNQALTLRHLIHPYHNTTGCHPVSLDSGECQCQCQR